MYCIMYIDPEFVSRPVYRVSLYTILAVLSRFPSSFLSALIKLPKNAVCQVCQLWK